MDVGKIIRFKRKELGMKQGELCKGICSITHLSKIENGKSNATDDIVHLLIERLGLDLDQEEQRLQNLSSILEQFYNAIIFSDTENIEKLKVNLEKNMDYIECAGLSNLYKLYLLRYFLFKEEIKAAYKLGKELESLQHQFSQTESNLLNHFWGIYFIINKDGNKSLAFLSKVKKEYAYSSVDFYYHLSLAYSLNSSNMLSYSYALKALESFYKHKLFDRIIDVEMLASMQLSKGNRDEVLCSIESLIKLLNFTDEKYKKAVILHNIGFSFSKLGQHEEAIKYYNESLKYKEKGSYSFLNSYYALLFSFILNYQPISVSQVKEGLMISRKINNEKYEVLFKTLLLYITDNEELYEFLDCIALDYFMKIQFDEHVKFYGKKLLSYYKTKNDLDKAISVAERLIRFKYKGDV